MKTVGEHLKEGLTIEHYELIKKYKDSYRWGMRAYRVCDALNMSMVWSMTSEGHDFWNKMYLELKQGHYNKYSNNIFLKL